MHHEDLRIRPFQLADEDPVVQLWHECGLVVPWNNPHKDIRRKLGVQAELFLVGAHGTELIATVMAGYDGHRGWINYLAVASAYRRRGIGRRMVEEVEKRLQALGCPKINLQVRSSNTDVIEFYQRIGFAVDDAVSLGKRLETD
jgi:ribosomal protein S18 acetylase RimI-like enzyme